MKHCICVCVAVLLLLSSAAWADLASEFAGYTTVNEIGVSGLKSSNGATKLPGSIFTLEADRVNYPGVGTVPSPGGTVGANFDEGILGVKTEGGNLIVKLAGALNPQTGYYHSGYQSTYGQGDVFLTVDDGGPGVGNFALLTQWGEGVHLGKASETHYDQAQSFHGTYQGYLVALGSPDDVALTGGAGAYTPSYSNSPDGLDFRVFAQGGTAVVDAGLQTGSVSDGRTWYLQTWTIALSSLSDESVFNIGLHAATSCSNDQIALETQVVPVPAAAVLGMLGLSVAGWRLRKRDA